MPSAPAAPRLPWPVPAGAGMAGPGVAPPGRLARARAAFAPEAERLVLWAPVALGCGIVLYFASPTEPGSGLLPAAALASCLAAIAAALARVPAAARLVLAAVALGLA
ncbi:MAG: hypothetical protein ACO3CC_15065, partial [Alphaproteobacteria bacterium]